MNWGTVPDWIMALVTGGAVFVAWRTLNYLSKQTAANEEAANAAKRSADEALKAAESLKSSERAYVFAKVVLKEPLVLSHEGTAITTPMTVFVNHGKTPAIILNMSGEAYLAESPPKQLTPRPDDDRRLPEGWVIASELEFERPIRLRITQQEMDEIKSASKTLFCAGAIKYKDILGHEHTTGYCWEYIPRAQRFTFCQDSPLNYYT